MSFRTDAPRIFRGVQRDRLFCDAAREVVGTNALRNGPRRTDCFWVKFRLSAWRQGVEGGVGWTVVTGAVDVRGPGAGYEADWPAGGLLCLRPSASVVRYSARLELTWVEPTARRAPGPARDAIPDRLA